MGSSQLLNLVLVVAALTVALALPIPIHGIEEALDLQTRGLQQDDSTAHTVSFTQLNSLLNSAASSNNRTEVQQVELLTQKLHHDNEVEELKEKHDFELMEAEKKVWIQRHELKQVELAQALTEEVTQHENREKSRVFSLQMINDIRELLKGLEKKHSELRNRTIIEEKEKEELTPEGEKRIGDEKNPAKSCLHILQSGSADVDGVYWLDTDGGDHANKFQAFCDMTSDEGGWTLLGTLTPGGTASAVVVAAAGSVSGSVWPDTFSATVDVDPATTGFFKGSLEPFTEVREEVAGGKNLYYGSNFTNDQMNILRNQYGFESRMEVASLVDRPDCRLSYTDPAGVNTRRGCAPKPLVQGEKDATTDKYVGWAINVVDDECYFASGASGSGDGPSSGSSDCPGKPDGSNWAKVWFR